MNIYGIRASDSVPVTPQIDLLASDYPNSQHINLIDLAHYHWLAERKTHDAIMIIYPGGSVVFTRDDWRHWNNNL